MVRLHTGIKRMIRNFEYLIVLLELPRMIRTFEYFIVFTSAPVVLPEQNAISNSTLKSE